MFKKKRAPAPVIVEPPPPPQPAPLPVAGTPQAERPVRVAQELAEKAEAKRRGRSSTILNGQVADGAVTVVSRAGNAPNRMSRILGYGR